MVTYRLPSLSKTRREPSRTESLLHSFSAFRDTDAPMRARSRVFAGLRADRLYCCSVHGDDHLGSLAVLLWRICNVHGSVGTFDGRCIAHQRGLNNAQASGDLRWMHATRYQRILRSFVCHLPGNAAEALRQNEPDFRSARLIVLSLESCHTGSERAH